MSRVWRDAVDGRLAGRDQLSKEDLHRQFWSELPQQDVLEALGTIESESDVTVGLMRPTDMLGLLFEPPPTKNPLKQMAYQVHAGDAQFELSRFLTKRLKKHGRASEWNDRIDTLDDFVRAWCGQPVEKAARLPRPG